MQWLFIQHLFANANKQKCARKQIGVNVSSNFLTHTPTYVHCSCPISMACVSKTDVVDLEHVQLHSSATFRLFRQPNLLLLYFFYVLRKTAYATLCSLAYASALVDCIRRSVRRTIYTNTI